jgi:hypothetical protein
MLRITGEPVVVYDITGPLQVPTFLCYLGDAPAAAASGASAGAAMTDLLEQVLLFYQARHNGQTAYAPPAVPDLPRHLQGTLIRPFKDDPPLDNLALAAALNNRGHQPVSVPLDHDPEVHSVMPYTVHVVLADA